MVLPSQINRTIWKYGILIGINFGGSRYRDRIPLFGCREFYFTWWWYYCCRWLAPILQKVYAALFVTFASHQKWAVANFLQKVHAALFVMFASHQIWGPAASLLPRFVCNARTDRHRNTDKKNCCLGLGKFFMYLHKRKHKKLN